MVRSYWLREGGLPSALLLFATLAIASSIDDVLRAEDLLRSGRPGEASQDAAALLRQDEGDLGAHYVLISARTRGLRDGLAVEAQYRQWLEREPDLLAARFGLAAALTMAHIPEERDGPWCIEVESLIGGVLPDDPSDAVWTLRLRIDARRHCPADAASDLAALATLRSDYALALSIREKTRNGQISTAVADNLERLITRAPELTSEAGVMVVQGYGDGLERASGAQLRAQRSLVAHEEPRVVAFAASVLTAAGDHGSANLALNRLYQIDPQRSWTVPTSEGITRWFARERPHSNQRDPSALRRRLAMALGPGSPGRRDEATQQLRAIWERDPRDTAAAYAFARAAAMNAVYLDMAVAALNHAIDTAPAWDPRGRSRAESYDAWKREAAADVGLWLCERGWLRRGMGQLDLAAGDLRLAILSHPDPPAEFHMRLGLVYYELGYEEDALFQLGRGLSLEGGKLHREEARNVAERIFAKLAWAPGGLDGWIAARGQLTPLPQ